MKRDLLWILIGLSVAATVMNCIDGNAFAAGCGVFAAIGWLKLLLEER